MRVGGIKRWIALRASRMLSTTKEVTSVKDAKSDAVGKHDSSIMPQSVLVARKKIGHLPGDKPSLKYKPRKATGPNEADDHKETENIYCEGRLDIVQSAQLRAENLTTSSRKNARKWPFRRFMRSMLVPHPSLGV